LRVVLRERVVKTEKRDRERVEDLTLDGETFETAVREIWRAEPPSKKQQKRETERADSEPSQEVRESSLLPKASSVLWISLNHH
jgi:predicted RNase H-like nuclease (RuvC/YqgF family)